MRALIIMFLILAILIICAVVARGDDKIYWKGIVVHHSGSNYDNFEKIDAYHRSKGWDCCGYHYVIEKDGDVFEGRPLTKVGAHAKTCGPNRNRTHIGICLCGNEAFTYEQKTSLHDLCVKLTKEFSIIEIQRHHSECPGPGLDVEKLEKELFAGI